MEENAQWIKRTHLFKRDEYECSVCKYKTDKPHKVCPGCGRTMNGIKYDPSWVDEAEIIDAIFDD